MHMCIYCIGGLFLFSFFFLNSDIFGRREETNNERKWKQLPFVMCPQRSIRLFLCVDESIMSPGTFMHNLRPIERTGNATLFWTSVRTKCQAIRREHSCVCFCCLTNNMAHKIQTSSCLKMFICIIMIVKFTVWNILVVCFKALFSRKAIKSM